MAATPFRPTVYSLETRDVPASGVTPTQVFTAIDYVNATPAILTYLQDNLDLAKAGGAGQALLGAADLNHGAADTLTKFVADAREAAAVNPAAAGTLNELAANATALIVTANSSATAAELLANRLGTFRPVPPPPPVTGVGDSNISPNPDQNGTTPVTPSDTTPPPTDGSRITTAVPTLTDPGFTASGTQGLRVRDVRVGEGTAATATSTVQVRYRGFLASNGTSFDNNVGTATPLTAVLGPVASRTVIQGFAEGIVGMKVGGIRDIDIPSELGYGASGSGTSIPPNSRLVFEVQLVSVS